MNASVEIENLRKVFILKSGWGRSRVAKEVVAVDQISLSIPAGQSVAFIGPNGAGKSTTIKMLTGILHPTSGSAHVLGFTPLERAAQAGSPDWRGVWAALAALVSSAAARYV